MTVLFPKLSIRAEFCDPEDLQGQGLTQQHRDNAPDAEAELHGARSLPFVESLGLAILPGCIGQWSQEGATTKEKEKQTKVFALRTGGK